jgi:putative Mg2+ transporter-C (MgtC) family protein
MNAPLRGMSTVVMSAQAPQALAGVSGGQGPVQFAELGLAFVLSALIGLERELRHKPAGLRTHTLVGVGAALIMLVSKYGFMDVLVPGKVIVDPSRVAAQIVSGIGFLGAGLIFVRRDAVRGLTTAAVVWLVAAIGMACAGGLAGLAVAVTGIYFIALYAFPALVRRMPKIGLGASALRLEYEDGKGALRQVLGVCTGMHFRVAELAIAGDATPHPGRTVTVDLVLYGRGALADLAVRLQEVDGVLSVRAADPEASD